MSESSRKRGFAARPAAAEDWIRTPDRPLGRSQDASAFTARLTIDITPELRARIKITAFQRGLTVTDMLRDLLASEFPAPEGERS